MNLDAYKSEYLSIDELGVRSRNLNSKFNHT